MKLDTTGRRGRQHGARRRPGRLRIEREDRRPGARGRRPAPTAGGLVGVTMPTKSSERWIHDGDNIKAALEKLGYKVDLQYAENDIPTQVNQIENQITKGAKLLIIASIDGTALTTQLQEAADNKIPVIAYDRLIRNSPNVDYYATFDNFKVGVAAGHVAAGRARAEERGRHRRAPPRARSTSSCSPARPTTTTPPSSSTARCRCSSRYIDNGTLVVKSGQTDFKTVAILRWDPATAQRRMEDLLTSTYSGGAKVDGVLSPVRRPVHRHPLGAEERRLRHRRPAVPDRHRPGRRGRLGQVDHRR